MPDHAYAWILGAGASKPSGIPLAGELVQRWLGELQRRLDGQGQPLAKWATPANLGVDKFRYDQAASFYSKVYERRFGDNPDEGFAYLEDLMSKRDPSPGYSILAQILDKTPHKVVISTNFDNLVADALSIYTSTFPLVIGHESLANFVKIVSRRPVICKIHRDLLLGPKSDTRSLRRLHESWAAALRALFSQYTPLFVGYGGNDDSLMDLLESLDPGDIKGQLIWCYYERFEPNQRIQELVAQHRGTLVPVPDFDMLMVLLGAQLGIEPIDDAIEKRAAERAKSYRKQLVNLDTTAHPDVRRVLRGAFERAGGTLAWLEKTRTEPSTDRREQIFLQALEEYPESTELQMEFGTFLRWHGRDLPRARSLMVATQDYNELVCLELDLGNIDAAQAAFAQVVEPEYSKATLACIREQQDDIAAAELLLVENAADGDANSLLALAWFYERRGRGDESTEMLERACELYPQSPDCVSALGRYLWVAQVDVDRAGALFRVLLGLEAAESSELVPAAAFFLARGERDMLERTFKLLALKSMRTGDDEAMYLTLKLVDAISINENVIQNTELLRNQMTHHYVKDALTVNLLTVVLEAPTLRLPPSYRKFLVALAHALSDPARRSNLNNFPQWRVSAEPGTTKSDA